MGSPSGHTRAAQWWCGAPGLCGAPPAPGTHGTPPRAEHGLGGGLGRLSIGGRAAAAAGRQGSWRPVARQSRQGGATHAAGPPGWCGAPRPYPTFSTTRADNARGGAAKPAYPARRLPPAWSGSGLRLAVQTNERDTRWAGLGRGAAAAAAHGRGSSGGGGGGAALQGRPARQP